MIDLVVNEAIKYEVSRVINFGIYAEILLLNETVVRGLQIHKANLKYMPVKIPRRITVLCEIF